MPGSRSREAHGFPSFRVRPPSGWRGSSPPGASRPMSTPARARFRRCAGDVVRRLVAVLIGSAASGRDGQSEAEAVGELFRRAARRVGFERVRVDDADEAVGLDDARFPLVAGDLPRTRPPRPGPRRRRASDGPSAGTSGPAASRSRPGRMPRRTRGPCPGPSSAPGAPARRRGTRRAPGRRIGLDPRDRGERRPAEVAVLGVGEWLEDRVRASPTARAARAAPRRSPGREPSPTPRPAASSARADSGRDAVAGEDEQAAPALDELAQALRVGVAEVVDVRQHDGLGLLQVGQARAAVESRPSAGRTATWHSARPAARAGARPGGSRSPTRTRTRPGSPSTSSTRGGGATERARNRRSSNGNSSPAAASTCPRQSPSGSSSSGNSTVAVAPPSRSTVRSRSRFWPLGLDVEPDGTLRDRQGRGVEHGRGDRGRLAGPGGRAARSRCPSRRRSWGTRGRGRGAGPRRPREESRARPDRAPSAGGRSGCAVP